MTREEKKKWIKKLKPYALAYEKVQDQYSEGIFAVERLMNRELKSKVWEYEFFITDCGWLIGRMNRKTGEKQGLVHDDEFRKEVNNVKR